MSEWVTAFAPASIGNVAVGFAMLGLALDGAGDRVLARRTDNDRVTVLEVRVQSHLEFVSSRASAKDMTRLDEAAAQEREGGVVRGRSRGENQVELGGHPVDGEFSFSVQPAQ